MSQKQFPVLWMSTYANDLPDSHQGSETMVCLFADDTKLSRVLSSTEYRFELQEGLNDFMNWADQWQLRVAEHKCLVLSHGNCDPPSYYLKDVNLDNVDHHKDLGVIVDDHCLFKQHVSYICKKAYCSTNVLFRCFNTANTVALIRGYKSFIRPVLEYCSTVWNPYIHRVRTHPGKPGKYWNLIIRIPGLEYTGILSEVLENTGILAYFGAVFLPCLFCDDP